jgi:hypothetical protein
LRNSTIAIAEHDSANNHHAFFNVQATVIAAYVRDWKSVTAYLNEVTQHLIPTQIALDGGLPLELERTNSWHYSNFCLQAFCILATLSQHICDNHLIDPSVYGDLPDIMGFNQHPLDPFSSQSILGALNYLMPYLPQTAHEHWNKSHRQEFPVVFNEIVSPIRLLVAIFDNVNYVVY